ncbi:2-hydroxymuconic semialdehyde dehydrogenase [Pseudomonas yamanorum]|jgi:aminomuconate-semialdehyde/2-hydroxymuconate-6-semialdehyde dehydrogenase|uniref:2-hydroxymuconic semialdehyde dehydrogenase n=1 Tax=Pseudomonas yamanorum TaxID=515393 RepID=A0A7Y8K3Y3_9PSED|nr:2-hydroxymuconic semialdehyde dehydrogenase [Pseudomonas yamanorum]NWE39202.1 2-hydroxymuconic semialdehyde dehydrogenase [Pseudomonas yamanorum]NWE75041.1 2-hydroxymuconic semialdehyde dehydrogenase [Pseudomonas yamanorum]
MTKHFHNFIDNQWVEGVRTFDNRNPADNSVIGQVHEAGREQVDAAVNAARAALNGPWGKMTVAQRTALLHKVADGIEQRAEEFVAAEVADTGKPHALASHLDIPRGAANFKVFADLIRNVPTESFTMDTPDGGKAVNYAVRNPRGVIGVICPWNLPLLLMTWKVGPALACGNTVVVKPSEETPATATLLGEVMRDAGVPAGVYNVVHGFGEHSAGAFLTEHPGVDGITFTGETGTGEAIMKAASKGVRPVSLELGGKNAGVIFADADLDKAVAGIARAVFENSGQVCLGTERVYVQRPLFAAFVAALKVRAEAIKVGPPNEPGVTMGPLVSVGHRQKVLSYYQQAAKDGATVVTGGGIPDMPAELAEGAWVQPTIWTGLSEDSAVVREEIFGPCCHIAPFDDEDEVVRLVNDTPYGLAASVWTTNLQVAHRMGAALDVGICWINSWFLRDLRTAFGGAKQSGIGREGGVHSLEFYTELRNVCIRL